MLTDRNAEEARHLVNADEVAVVGLDGAARRQVVPARPSPATTGPAAEVIRPLVQRFLDGEPPVRFELWDGSGFGPDAGPGRVVIRSADAIRRMLWAPGELGVGRAYVAGDIEIEGDIVETLRALKEAAPNDLRIGLRAVPEAARAARRLALPAAPPPPPAEEAKLGGWRPHSKRRDAEAISHHYDVGNDFYRLVLGPSMTYSCARFADGVTSVDDAQSAKHELICRKLGLHERPSARLLDVGCGWGSLAIHAATHHGVRAVGITISRQQAARARERAAEAGVADRVEIRLQDYRDLGGEQFDAISSVGMFEHVGRNRMEAYFTTLRSLLAPRGRFLNHAISTPRGSQLGRRTFVYRYVFPDGDLLDVGDVVLAMERAGFEVRDVESLREHYAKTLRAWVGNLEAAWPEAVAQVGEARARVWRLYMAASALGFEGGGLGLHQVLGVATDAEGDSGMPPTRTSWG